MAARYSPTVRKRILGIELRKIRERRGLTGQRASAEIDISPGMLSSIETAKRNVTKAQLMALLDVYRIDNSDPVRSQLLLLHQTSRQPAWWQGMGVPAGSYVDLEAEAQEIRSYDALMVPGLLQTERYAEEIILATSDGLTDDEIAQRVKVRRQRAALLDQGLKLWTIIDEAALRRIVGCVEIMREELGYLADRIDALPNLTVQVLRFADGAHQGLDGGFALLYFEDHPPLGCTERGEVQTWLEKGYEVDSARLRWDHVLSVASSERNSASYIRSVARELQG